jgi:hypothetical protein
MTKVLVLDTGKENRSLLQRDYQFLSKESVISGNALKLAERIADKERKHTD